MTSILKITIVILTSTIVGCVTPLPLEDESAWDITTGEKAELLVFRESGSHTRFAPLYFGSDKAFTHRLNEHEYFQTVIPLGEHKFRVGGNGSDPSEISATVTKNTITCVRLGTRADAWFSLLEMPFVSAFEAYALGIVNCPSNNDLSTLRKVSGKKM